MHLTLEQQDHKALLKFSFSPEEAGVDPLPLLVDAEYELSRQGVQSLVLQLVAEPDDSMVARFKRLSYQPAMNDPLTFTKEVYFHKAARFSITEKCNYKCFFCHEEGLEMGVERQEAEEAALFQLLDQLKGQQCLDFTFTGGEPLLQKRKILRCLDYMKQIGYLPEITFVSNGLAITGPFIEALQQWPGKVRFNISMHSLESTTYAEIVQNLQTPEKPLPDVTLARVQTNLQKLQAARIPFKLNFVLLKGLNTSRAALDEIFKYSLNCGASHIKFLELLITSDLNHLYPYYYRLQALKDQLGSDLKPLTRGVRRDVYQYKDTSLKVELQHCTCARGCNICALNRDMNFTAELRYFPCFLHPEEDQDLKKMPISEAAQHGEQKIASMANYYGDDSPIIIRDAYLIEQESYFYYHLPKDQEDSFKNALESLARLERRRVFSENYLTNGQEDVEAFKKVRKVTINSYDEQGLEICQSFQLHSQNPGLITTYFETEGRLVPSWDAHLEQLAADNWQPWFQLNWDVHFYRNSPSKAGGDISITLSRNQETGLLLVRSTRPLPELAQLKPLSEPPVAFIAARRLRFTSLSS